MDDSTRLLPHLAATVRGMRKSRSVAAGQVARAAGVDITTVYRFERAVAWPRDPDVLIAGYAQLLDRAAVTVWAMAVVRLEADTRRQP